MSAPDPADDSGDDLVEIALGEAAVQQLAVTSALSGERIDKAVALLLPGISRSRIRQWIDASAIRVNGTVPRPRDAVVEGDLIEVVAPPEPDALAYAPQSMALDIVHADDAIIVIDKPPGLVVHPGAGNWSGTLLNGLLAYDPRLAHVPRAGIVHRLDADTSGLMVVARTLAAQVDLVRQLQARSVMREYWAVVVGAAPLACTIDAAIARDPRNPLKFKVSHGPAAKEARTRVRRIECVDSGRVPLSWIACRLDTGRTHQIRVHLESIGHPLVGDPTYRRGRPGAAGAAVEAMTWSRFPRQALHACRLGIMHPSRGELMTWFRPPPADMQALMRASGFRRCDRPREVFQ